MMKASTPFDDIALYILVAELKSFSAVGRRMGLPASSIMRRMDGLERSLGAKLISRSTRQLGLTEAGELFIERAKLIMANFAEARDLVHNLDAEPRGTLRIDASNAFGRRHVVPVVQQMLGEYPAIRINLSLNDEHIDLISEGVDIAIRIGVLPDSNLLATKLAPLRRVVCATPEYLNRFGRPETPEDLDSHVCLTHLNCNSSALNWRFMYDGEIRSFPVKGRFAVNNVEALVEMVLQGAGIAHLPTWLIHEDLVAGRLVPLLDTHSIPENLRGGVYAVRTASRTMPVKVGEFLARLRARLEAIPVH
jgi:LysR family transcriptional regulator, pyoluteorin biosynthesis regulator